MRLYKKCSVQLLFMSMSFYENLGRKLSWIILPLALWKRQMYQDDFLIEYSINNLATRDHHHYWKVPRINHNNHHQLCSTIINYRLCRWWWWYHDFRSNIHQFRFLSICVCQWWIWEQYTLLNWNLPACLSLHMYRKSHEIIRIDESCCCQTLSRCANNGPLIDTETFYF